MTNIGDFWPILLALAIVLLRGYGVPRSSSIHLASDKFWALVKSQERPVVLLATRGFFGTQMCYVFPHQGVLFRTDAKKPEAPEGVILIGAGNSLTL